MEKINTITLSSSAIYSRLLRSVSEVQDNCWIRKPKYSANVARCYHTWSKATNAVLPSVAVTVVYKTRTPFWQLSTLNTLATLPLYNQRKSLILSEKREYVHVMYRPLTISTELKLAAAFWAGFRRNKIILLAYCPKLNMSTRLFHFLLLQNQSGLSNFCGDKDVKRFNNHAVNH